MSELEIRSIEIIQTEHKEKIKQGKNGRRIECPTIVGQCQKSDRCVIRIPDGEKMNKADKTFENIKAQTFQKLMKCNKSKIQKVQQISQQD